MSEAIIHWISGGMFFIGCIGAYLGTKWMKKATATLNEATAYYERVKAERIAEAKASLSNSVAEDR